MSELYEAAVDLINRAKFSGDTDEKVKLLAAISEVTLCPRFFLIVDSFSSTALSMYRKLSICMIRSSSL